MDIDARMLGERIQALRIERQLTQEQLAAYTGLSAHYIGNLEQGVRRPSLGSILLLCRGLGAMPNDLFADFITEEMRAGLCFSVEDDPYALRDSMSLLTTYFGDCLDAEDEESAKLIPQGDASSIQQLPLSKLLIRLQK